MKMKTGWRSRETSGWNVERGTKLKEVSGSEDRERKQMHDSYMVCTFNITKY